MHPDRIFSVVWVFHIAIGPSVERGQITRNSVLELRCVLFASVGDGVSFTCDVRLLRLHDVYASLLTLSCTALAKHLDTGLLRSFSPMPQSEGRRVGLCGSRLARRAFDLASAV